MHGHETTGRCNNRKGQDDTDVATTLDTRDKGQLDQTTDEEPKTVGHTGIWGYKFLRHPTIDGTRLLQTVFILQGQSTNIELQILWIRTRQCRTHVLKM